MLIETFPSGLQFPSFETGGPRGYATKTRQDWWRTLLRLSVKYVRNHPNDSFQRPPRDWSYPWLVLFTCTSDKLFFDQEGILSLELKIGSVVHRQVLAASDQC